MMGPTDKYQTCRISKPGIPEMSTAGTANKINRLNELNSGGSVFPIPWNTLELVKTIPAEMKLNETIRRYSLPKQSPAGLLRKCGSTSQVRNRQSE